MAGRKQKNPPLSPDVAAIADRLHSDAIHVLRRVHKQDAPSGEGPARLSPFSRLPSGADDAGPAGGGRTGEAPNHEPHRHRVGEQPPGAAF